MAFKLGSSKKLDADRGNIKSKLSFKSGDEIVPGTTVFRKQLGKDVIAEANYDGSIYIDKSIKLDDLMMQQALAHEMQHITAMKLGTEYYDDNAVYYKGEVWRRNNGYVTDPKTGERFAEGDRRLPWENNKI